MTNLCVLKLMRISLRSLCNFGPGSNISLKKLPQKVLVDAFKTTLSLVLELDYLSTAW